MNLETNFVRMVTFFRYSKTLIWSFSQCASLVFIVDAETLHKLMTMLKVIPYPFKFGLFSSVIDSLSGHIAVSPKLVTAALNSLLFAYKSGFD